MKVTLAEHYSPKVFDRLPEFPTAKAQLDRARDALLGLGRVICRHKMNEQFGVNLLHQHFALLPDEQLIKRRLKDGRAGTIRPVRRFDSADAYFWQPVMSGGQIIYHPLEFFGPQERPDELVNIQEAFKQAPAFFEEFALTALELEVQNTFGLALLHPSYFKVGDEDITLETTDSERRVLNLEVIDRSLIDMNETTQTLWFFTPSTCSPAPDSVSAPKSPTSCIGHCKTHCQTHCTSHCNGHCTDHCKAHCASHCQDHK